MAGVGIDLGNVNCVIAMARRGGIDVLANEVSNRATPAMVGFQGEQRNIGEAAATFAMQNFKHTCTDLRCLIGVKADAPEAKELASWVENKVMTGPDGFLSAECTYGAEGKSRVFSYEALNGALLSKLLQIASDDAQVPVTECVVSVPAFYTDLQRRAVLDSAKIGNVKVLRLMNEHAAIALNYGIFRTAQLPEDKPLKVAFVDVGQHKTTVSIADFLKSGAKVLSAASDSSLGGRDWDLLLGKYFAAEFQEKYKLDVFSATRPKLRLLKECEKIKKVLSANPEAPLNIECLMEDTDVKSFMKRDNFNEMMAPLLERIEKVCKEAIEAAGITDLTEIVAVEIVGGGSRIPAIKTKVQEVFGQTLKTTLNADEAVSRGCALMAAMMSPTLRVREYALSDASPYTLSAVKAQDDDMVEGDDIVLVPKSTAIPCLKAVSLKNTGPCRMVLRKDKSIPIADYSIGAPAPQEGEAAKLRVKVRVNSNGIASVSSAALLIEEEVEEKVTAEESKTKDKPEAEAATTAPSEEQKDAGAEAEAAPEAAPDAAPAPAAEGAETVKKVKKTKTVELTVTRGTVGMGLSEASVQKCVEDEAEMKATDLYLKERADALNALESYVYDSRSKLDDYGNLKAYTPEDVRQSILKELNEAEEWIYSEEAEEAQKSSFVDRKQTLASKIEPIQKRYIEDENRPSAGRKLNELCLKYKEVLVPNEEKYAHLTEEEKITLASKCEEAMLWLQKATEEQAALPKDVDPTLTVEMIETKKKEVQTVCQPIMDKPKPKPKKEEPAKTEEKPAEKSEEAPEEKPAAADVEMEGTPEAEKPVPMEEEVKDAADAPKENGEETTDAKMSTE